VDRCLVVELGFVVCDVEYLECGCVCGDVEGCCEYCYCD